jgi:hypothetical protein
VVAGQYAVDVLDSRTLSARAPLSNTLDQPLPNGQLQSNGVYSLSTPPITSKAVAQINFPFRYDIQDHAEVPVDFHFGFGLSHVALAQCFAVGYSFRVDHCFAAFLVVRI